ncbi:hypothetical protein PTKIN_Ptkin12aG0155200 [Pterospermum kingtungense]
MAYLVQFCKFKSVFDKNKNSRAYLTKVTKFEGKTQSLSKDDTFVEIEKLGRNSRRIRSKIRIKTSLDTVWNVLTDYKRLTDFIPALAVSKVVEKKKKIARVYQVLQQNLPMGLKFKAKAVIESYEKDVEILPSGKKREIQFKMVEGDFTCFEGTWLIEQVRISCY